MPSGHHRITARRAGYSTKQKSRINSSGFSASAKASSMLLSTPISGVSQVDIVTWLPTAVGSALGFVLWQKLDRLDKKMDQLFETELRALDARLSVVETHLGIKGPPR